jgi:uncharacterized SAM-binding protein YcdF (DUF218 family)
MLSAVVGICFAIFLFVIRRYLLRAIAKFLIATENDPSEFDAIVLLNGNISTRPFCASKLYKRCAAPILIARLADTEETRMGIIPNISQATVKLLHKLNVPAADVHLLESQHWVAGTWDEAILLLAYIRKMNYRNIIIVTDAFHSRRARWTFRRLSQDSGITFRCVATPFTLGIANQWWRSEFGLVQVFVEHLKFLHYRRLGFSLAKQGVPQETDLPLAKDVRRIILGEPVQDSTTDRNSP